MKIIIGAGDVKMDGFVTCDFDPNTKPDYLINLEKDPLPFENDTVETVIAHHILEHLGDGYFFCLQELYRVCKHGAIIDIRVPHHRHDSFAADPTHRRPITIIGLQLFSKKFNRYCREKGYASSRLGEYYNVDFEILDYKYTPDDRVFSKYSAMSQQEIEDYAHEHYNIISEIHVKMVVNKND